MSTENTENTASTETAEQTAAVETPGVTDAEAIVAFIDDEIDKINKLPKKSNYHNARRSMAQSIRNLIVPPAPKPKKEKKSKAKGAAAGADASNPASPGNVEQPAAATDVDTTRVEPNIETA